MPTIPFPLSREQLERVAANHPTPFHLYDERAIRENVRRLHKAFAWSPGYKEFFAVKALPNPSVLALLREEGCGVDCASMTELMMAKAVGFTGEEIFFSSNQTPAAEYDYARGLGAFINLDDLGHIEMLAEHGGIPETICCRFNPGGVFAIGNAIMDNPGDAKFGMTREQIFEAFRRLMGLGAKTFGLHAFLVSNAVDPAYYPMLARQLFALAVELHRETGARIGFVNLSGGLGIPYRPEEKPLDIEAIGEAVRCAYEEVVVAAGLPEVAIYMESGRFVTGPYGWLVTRVLHEKRTHKHYLGVDASACNLMRPAIYRAYHEITVSGKEDAPADGIYDVVGALCENNDKFAIDRPLPKTEVGDLLIIHDTGAHGHAMGYNYNGKLRSAEVLLRQDGTTREIRRAERPADYFATLMDGEYGEALRRAVGEGSIR